MLTIDLSNQTHIYDIANQVSKLYASGHVNNDIGTPENDMEATFDHCIKFMAICTW